MRRKQDGKQAKKWPEAFTVGSSYLPQIGCFAGLQCRNTAFARALALALVFPLMVWTTGSPTTTTPTTTSYQIG
jgi:hypothetical protein